MKCELTLRTDDESEGFLKEKVFVVRYESKGFLGRIPLQEQNEIAACVQLCLGTTVRDIVENAVASRNNSDGGTLPRRARRIWAGGLQLRNHTRISKTAESYREQKNWDDSGGSACMR